MHTPRQDVLEVCILVTACPLQSVFFHEGSGHCPGYEVVN